MRRRWWALAGTAAVVVAVGVVATAGAGEEEPPAADGAISTAPIERGSLADVVSRAGTLTYEGQADGTPFRVVNRASGTYTQLPDGGAAIGCGEVLYRVDDRPVLLLCGTVPAYREVRQGDAGADVHQLNQNLHQLGLDADPEDRRFTARTEAALEQLQRDRGLEPTGALAADAAVFLPGPVRVADLSAVLGGPAQPGAEVLAATSDVPVVQVELDALQQGAVEPGDLARITLPGNRSATGKVERLGRIAQAPSGPDAEVGAATIGAYISLDRPEEAGSLDEAPVQVAITTRGVDDALSVPVTALFGRAGGGFAVEVVRDRGRRELVDVSLGLFDSAGGRVQVEGELREGERVVVPPS